MSNDHDYLVNYKPNQLYKNPGRQGAYATIVGESEELIGEVDVTAKCKLAISAFWVRDRRDFGTFKITKMKHHAKSGWSADGEVKVNQFQLSQISQFLSVIARVDLSDEKSMRLSLDNLNLGVLGTILNSSKGPELLAKLAEAPELHTDVYAVASKRQTLADFEKMLSGTESERSWQDFFEANPWIFGHGLNYVFLDGLGGKLEKATTGSTFDRSGKRTDALMRTRAEISQFVLVELKKSSTELLMRDPYRSGCWGISSEVSSAVTQIQKTTYEFSRDRFRQHLKDGDGNYTGEAVYSIEPRSYLVVGNLGQLIDNEDKITCFELFRRNIRAPEILTFDELYQRTRCIVDNISQKVETDDIPF
ncbi:DUF4263 domain-containing protein [Rhizobium sp. CRIBSB]|nr:DUF4263 domain-containing protein [Rhizobium sp. CRIBSB]